ncbi:hypothetical protein [Arenivirga flava]|uniref:Uncharacterized protein n=1 Tax=Arenivirga flava TaxID=1930060 RepID=A0AA37XBY7_9MICO|nr:hypothetical protein [Arenivirga flava]GMA29323.1 hypothetical protein GCM10025874_25760 [Arenivirga flava]
MERALQELSRIGDEHERITAAQRRSLVELRARSVALVLRGVPIDEVASAVGLSTVAVAGWMAPASS